MDFIDRVKIRYYRIMATLTTKICKWYLRFLSKAKTFDPMKKGGI